MSGQALSISVVIPAYNAAATMAECLGALNRQSVGRNAYEVIVVDDGSTDGTADIASRYGARVLKQPNAGAASARNKGIGRASGDIILFTDSDCAPAPDWMQEMLVPFADPQIVGVKGVYRTRQRNLAARFIQLEYEDRYDRTLRHEYVDFVDTYAAAYKRSVLVAAGGFDTRLRWLHDQELSFRLASMGYKMVFNPRAVVYHHHPDSWRKYAWRKYRIGYWKTVVLGLHPTKALRDSHTPFDLKLEMLLIALSAPVALLSPWAKLCAWLLAILVGLFVLTALPFLVKAWHRDRPLILVSLPGLFVRAWALGLGLLAGYIDACRRHGPHRVLP